MTKARQDRLLAALIAKLPAGQAPWRRDERVAWLRMMATAFDVVYGPCAPVVIAPADTREDASAADLSGPVPRPAVAPAADALSRPRPPARRFTVDHDGFATGDGQPIAIEELPEGATLWDERTGLECGDVTAILWRDIGTTRRSLPLGVTLKPATEARPPHSNNVA
jgi:hypothetical protein